MRKCSKSARNLSLYGHANRHDEEAPYRIQGKIPRMPLYTQWISSWEGTQWSSNNLGWYLCIDLSEYR